MNEQVVLAVAMEVVNLDSYTAIRTRVDPGDLIQIDPRKPLVVLMTFQDGDAVDLVCNGLQAAKLEAQLEGSDDDDQVRPDG